MPPRPGSVCVSCAFSLDLFVLFSSIITCLFFVLFIYFIIISYMLVCFLMRDRCVWIQMAGEVGKNWKELGEEKSEYIV